MPKKVKKTYLMKVSKNQKKLKIEGKDHFDQLKLKLGNCDKFNFTIEFKVQMWVQIYQIF
jgi:hypothetical protein